MSEPLTDDDLDMILARADADWETKEPVVVNGRPGYAIGPLGDPKDDVCNLINEVRRLREREDANSKLLESVKEWFPPEHYAAITAENDRLRQQVAEKPLAWTKDPPTAASEAGDWYWWRKEGYGVTMIRVERAESGKVFCWEPGTEEDWPPASIGGEWAGPLTPPTGGVFKTPPFDPA